MRKLFTLLITCMLFLTLHAQPISDFPWTEGFEGSSSLPAGWTQEYSLNYEDWYISSTGSYAGNNHAKFYVVETGGVRVAETYLITPAIDLSAIVNAVLSFQYYSSAYSTYIDTIGIYYRPATGGNWIYLGSYNQPTGSNAINYIPLSYPIDDISMNEPIQIGFKVGFRWGYGIGIDDITIDGIPASGCFRVSDLGVSDILFNNATVTWAQGGEETEWLISYKKASETTWSDWVLVENILSYSFDAVPLSSGTEYIVRVAALCGEGDTSSYRQTTFTTLASCPAPSNLSAIATTITANGATLSWYSPSQPPATAYENYTVEYKVSGTDWSTAVTLENVVDIFVNLTALLSNTLYDARVRVNCTGDDSSSWITTTFRTACGQIMALPFMENFDGYGTGETVMPDCWTRMTTSTANRPYVSTGGVTGNCLYFYAGLPGYNLAIMPPLDEAIDISNLMISFAYKGLYVYDTLRIGVMTDVANANTFEEIAFVTGTNSWRDFEVFSSSYTGTGQFIAFKVNRSHDSFGYLDNLTIDTIPACPNPQNFTATQNTPTSVRLNWTEESGVVSRILEYKKASESTWNTAPNVTAPPYILADLDAENEYNFRLKLGCGGTDESNYRFADVYIGYYCIPTFTGTYTGYNTNSFVTTGSSITNLQDNTVCTTLTYYDRTSLPFEASPGDVLNFTASYAGGTHGIAIWVDLDQNYTFEATERVYNTTSYYSSPHSGTITIPTDIPSGTYRVRVQIDGNRDNPADPCQNTTGNIIDYVLTITIPSCPRPANLTVENITTTDATVNWAQGSDETEWLFSYKLSSGTNWFSETHITSLLPVYLTSLDANSLYDVRVRAICGEGDTSLYSSTSFRTLCSSITTLPIIENFEGYGTGETIMPDCWIRITTYADRPYVSTNGVTGNCLYFFAGTSGTYNIAVMPPLDEAIDISNLMISFAYKGYYTYDTLRIGVMTNATDANTFEEITFVTGTTSWRDFELFLSSYTGTGRFIAFRVNNPGSSFAYLDNLEINTAPVCDGPTNMQITTTANNMIEVTWEGGPDDIGWRYQLTSLTMGEEFPEETRTLEEGPNYIFSGLQGGHEYQLCVKSECRAGLLSAEVCTTFRTPASEYTITVTREPVNGGTVNPPGPVTLAPGSAQAFTITPSVNFSIEQVLLDGNEVTLTAEGVYTISNIRQNHLLHVRFKDHTGVDENNLSKEVMLYPNPAQNAIYIETQSLYKKVEIINVIGEVIYSGNVENMKFDLDISSYASGLYLVRLYGDQGMATKKFVKE